VTTGTECLRRFAINFLFKVFSSVLSGGLKYSRPPIIGDSFIYCIFHVTQPFHFSFIITPKRYNLNAVETIGSPGHRHFILGDMKVWLIFVGYAMNLLKDKSLKLVIVNLVNVYSLILQFKV